MLQVAYSILWNKIYAVGLVVGIPQAKVQVLVSFNYKVKFILVLVPLIFLMRFLSTVFGPSFFDTRFKYFNSVFIEYI